MIGLRGVFQAEAAQSSFQLVVVFQVGVDGDGTVHTYRQRCVPEVKTVEVGLLQTGLDGGFHALGAQQGVDVYRTVEQGVMPRDGAYGATVAQGGLGCHVGRIGVAGVAAQEVAQVHLAHLDVGRIGGDVLWLARRHDGLHRASAFMQGQVGVVALSVGCHLAVEGHALRQSYALGQHGADEAEVVGLGFEVYLSAQLLGLVHVIGHAVGLDV